MVAVPKSNIDRFVDAPPEQAILFLVHGADAGLVRERALRIVAKRVDDRRDPFQFVEMAGDAVASDPLTLIDEANTIPLFGGRRAILVEVGSKPVTEAVEMLLAAPPAACSIVFAAGALKKDAPLRKLIEPAKIGAAIECQPDEEKDLHGLIERTLREAGLHATPEAMGLLTVALGEDRMMSRAELAKLALYLRGRDKVEAADVEAIVAHASSIAGDRVVMAAFSGDRAAAGGDFDQSVAQGGDGQALLFGAMRYALALHRACLIKEREGGRMDGAIGAFMRAGFGYVHRALLESHLKLWTAARLQGLIEPLRAAQLRARARSDLARMEAARALLIIAQTAARR